MTNNAENSQSTKSTIFDDPEMAWMLGESPLDQPIAFTFFPNQQATTKRERRMSLRDFAQEIEDTTAIDKARLPWFKLARFGSKRSDWNCIRNNANVIVATGVELDFDDAPITPKEAAAFLEEAKIAALVFSTPSHLQPRKGNRFRVACPFMREHTPSEREAFVARANGVLGGTCDPASFTLSQSYYYGGTPDGTAIEIHLVDGRFIDHKCDHLDSGAIGKDGGKHRDRASNDNNDAKPQGHVFYGDFEVLKSAVLAVPASEEYWPWLYMGMAIWHETDGSPEGLELWMEQAGHDDGEMKKKWDSFGERTTGPKKDGYYIINLALAEGWVQPPWNYTEEHKAWVEERFEDLGPLPQDDQESEDESAGEVAQRRTKSEGLNFESRFEITLASEIKPEPFDWLWKHHLARGKGTIIGGRPGRGKSTIANYCASTISTGGLWPDGTRARRGNVLILSSEDAPNDTIVPRIMAAGGDRSRIGFLRTKPAKGNRKARMFSLKTDLAEVAKVIKAWGDVELVNIDPITAYMGENVDSHKTADVRAVLDGVSEWAQELKIAVLAITHPSKAVTSAMNSLTGSQAYVAFFRMCFLADTLPDDPKRRGLAVIKYNLGPEPPTLEYKIVNKEIGGGLDGQPVVEWGDQIDVTADQIVAGINEAGNPKPKIDLAKDFLTRFFDFIEPGEWIEVSKIQKKAEEEQLAWRTVERAKKDLPITAEKRGMKWGWIWRP